MSNWPSCYWCNILKSKNLLCRRTTTTVAEYLIPWTRQEIWLSSEYAYHSYILKFSIDAITKHQTAGCSFYWVMIRADELPIEDDLAILMIGDTREKAKNMKTTFKFQYNLSWDDDSEAVYFGLRRFYWTKTNSKKKVHLRQASSWLHKEVTSWYRQADITVDRHSPLIGIIRINTHDHKKKDRWSTTKSFTRLVLPWNICFYGNLLISLVNWEETTIRVALTSGPTWQITVYSIRWRPFVLRTGLYKLSRGGTTPFSSSWCSLSRANEHHGSINERKSRQKAHKFSYRP